MNRLECNRMGLAGVPEDYGFRRALRAASGSRGGSLGAITRILGCSPKSGTSACVRPTLSKGFFQKAQTLRSRGPRLPPGTPRKVLDQVYLWFIFLPGGVFFGNQAFFAESLYQGAALYTGRYHGTRSWAGAPGLGSLLEVPRPPHGNPGSKLQPPDASYGCCCKLRVPLGGCPYNKTPTHWGLHEGP